MTNEELLDEAAKMLKRIGTDGELTGDTREYRLEWLAAYESRAAQQPDGTDGTAPSSKDMPPREGMVVRQARTGYPDSVPFTVGAKFIEWVTMSPDLWNRGVYDILATAAGDGKPGRAP